MTKNKLVKEINEFYAALATEEPMYHNCYITKKDLENMKEITNIMHDLKENYFTHENAKPLYYEVCHHYIHKHRRPKRETRIKIRKTVTFLRTSFLCVAVFSIIFACLLMDSLNLMFPIVCFIVGMICFGISYALDYLLFETAYDNNESSPFMR